MASIGITEWLFWNSILLVMTIAAIRAKKFPTVAVLTLISLLIMWQHVAYVDVQYYGLPKTFPTTSVQGLLNATISYTDATGKNITEYTYISGKPGTVYLGYRTIATADEVIYVYIAWTCVLLINLASRLDRMMRVRWNL